VPASPLDRRLTGGTTITQPEPLSVLGTLLVAARRADLPFGEAWALGAEAALSYMNRRTAEQWWEALSATERAWADAYARRGSRLAAFTAEQMREP